MQHKKTVKKITKSKKKSVRLSSDVVPIHYTITLIPDLEAHVFSGTEHIDITLKKASNKIIIHAKELELFDISIKQGKEIEQAIKVAYDDKHESATLLFSKKIAPGKAKLTLSFRGILNDHMRGFYKSRYHVDGTERIMATTQFEANDARRCIPCFDEPAMKASFQVSLVVPNGKEAISNMLPTDIKEHSEGYKIVSFEKTPIMSTYLLAFLVGDFEYIEKTTKKGVRVRIITTPGKKEQGRFALDVTLKCLEYYEKYFDIDYPLNTLDMIAVPDFESGAMENWGAITYRETALLIDENHSSLSNRQRVAIVICHELAHQWFGNLVTMSWWNDLWLNEGFASYMEYLAVDHIFPSWHIWSQFLFSDHDRALRLDGMLSTHPIDVPVHDPNDIGQIFDAISYSKGASVIRQLASYIGEDNFRDGLRYYLKKHSFKNTETGDLWRAFEKVSKKKVASMMDIWTKRPGYPLISVSEKNPGTLLLSQKRFLSGSTLKVKNDTLWPVPVTLVSDEGESKPYLLSGAAVAIHKPGLSWCKVNSDETGFYRTWYSESLLTEMKQALSQGRLSEADRYGIVRDMIALTERGDYALAQVYDFVDCFTGETSYSVWSELTVLFSKTWILLKDTKERESFKSFMSRFLTPVSQHVGFTKNAGEDETQALLRSLVLAMLIKYEDKRVLAWVKKTYSGTIDPDLRGVVYGGMAKIGTPALYGILMKKYIATDQHQEKLRVLSSLGQFENVSLIEKNLKLLFSNHVRLQDSIYLFMSLTSHDAGRTAAVSFMKKNWVWFKDVSIARHMFSDFVKSLSGFKTEKEKRALKAFLEKKGTAGIELALSQTLEKIDQNIVWMKNRKEAQKYFKK